MSEKEFDQSLYVAGLIEKYLQGHPNAMDSMEGIRNWWITQQKLQESAYCVSVALDLLMEKGVVERVQGDLYRHATRN